MTDLQPLMIGDARIDRVVDLPRFELGLSWLFPEADAERLAPHRSWLEPAFMSGASLALAIQSFVLRIDGRTILVDTCVGEHKPRPRHPHWDRRSDTNYVARLATLGLSPDDIDIVFCTHLHADHVGWNTRLQDGRWVPTFPKARYVMGADELAHWQHELAHRASDDVNHGSYADSVLPVLETKRADLVEADHEVARGLVVRRLPGHTPGQIGLSLKRMGQGCLFCADAIHHPVQLVAPEWSSRLCADMDLARQTRRQFLAEAAEQGDVLVPAHFMNTIGLQIEAAGDGYRPRNAAP